MCILPLHPDSDTDGLTDSEEVIRETNPLNPDSDADGLEDGLEINAENPTDPVNGDSDKDGLLDGQEDSNLTGTLEENETDPTQEDTDNDGLLDRLESPEEATRAIPILMKMDFLMARKI